MPDQPGRSFGLGLSWGFQASSSLFQGDSGWLGHFGLSPKKPVRDGAYIQQASDEVRGLLQDSDKHHDLRMARRIGFDPLFVTNAKTIKQIHPQLRGLGSSLGV